MPKVLLLGNLLLRTIKQTQTHLQSKGKHVETHSLS